MLCHKTAMDSTCEVVYLDMLCLSSMGTCSLRYDKRILISVFMFSLFCVFCMCSLLEIFLLSVKLGGFLVVVTRVHVIGSPWTPVRGKCEPVLMN